MILRDITLFMSKIMIACIILLISPTPLLAYIDPGTASLIWQIILGAIVGGLYLQQFISLICCRIKFY